MSSKSGWLYVVVGLSSICLSCKHSSTGPGPIPPDPFGTNGKNPARMHVAGPYLYVCAGWKGLWRRETSDQFSWKFLGLADPHLDASSFSGVTDVAIFGSDILVSYNGSADGVSPDSTHAVYRSTDGGITWLTSDNGVRESRADSAEFDQFQSIARAPQNPAVVAAPLGPSFYLSTDGGTHWQLTGPRGLATIADNILWHPTKAGEFWTFGQTGFFKPYLIGRRDFGQTLVVSINFAAEFGVLSEGNVSDVVFDADAPDTMYATTNYGVFKSPDGGSTWEHFIHGVSTIGWIYHMDNDPKHPHGLIVSTSGGVFRSTDGLRTFTQLYRVTAGQIWSMAVDPNIGTVFVATGDDIFKVSP